ncbi:MAG: hypothetical protein IAE67_10135 [Candidatus Competibacteraceae bacterium]|nr:hypothetical protein [Candidatus Competibacteraceae bacterium]
MLGMYSHGSVHLLLVNTFCYEDTGFFYVSGQLIPSSVVASSCRACIRMSCGVCFIISSHHQPTAAIPTLQPAATTAGAANPMLA